MVSSIVILICSLSLSYLSHSQALSLAHMHTHSKDEATVGPKVMVYNYTKHTYVDFQSLDVAQKVLHILLFDFVNVVYLKVIIICGGDCETDRNGRRWG